MSENSAILEKNISLEIKNDSFLFLRLFWIKMFTIKNYIFALTISIIILFFSVTVINGYEYFAISLIIATLFIVIFLYNGVFFGFQKAHYYNLFKQYKWADLKIYLSLLLILVIFLITIFFFDFFISWIFYRFDFIAVGLNDVNDSTTPLYRYNNWQSWQWGFIFYEYILFILLAFTFCVLFQQIINSNKTFLLFTITLSIYFLVSIIINRIRALDWLPYVFDFIYETDSGEIFILIPEIGDYQYYDFYTNILYVTPRIREGRSDFLSVFSFFTNPFYSHIVTLGVATEIEIINPNGDFTFLYINGNGGDLSIHEIENFEIRIQFFHREYVPNTIIMPSNSYIHWWVYLMTPYIWIAFFIFIIIIFKIWKKYFN